MSCKSKKRSFYIADIIGDESGESYPSHYGADSIKNQTRSDQEDQYAQMFNLPSWIFCTRYTDRPGCSQRNKRVKLKDVQCRSRESKRPRTAFSLMQLNRLKEEFNMCPYLTSERRYTLAQELSLNESQIKIWFQNKRAKVKKTICQNDNNSRGISEATRNLT